MTPAGAAGQLVTETFPDDGVTLRLGAPPCAASRPAASWPSRSASATRTATARCSAPPPLPRTYLVAGTEEPFFLENAARWATALRAAGTDVTFTERPGTHGAPFWRHEFPLMLSWAFTP